ncbi:hypothetical protein H1R20_g4005, partial [Candolleomyces eurysporus]
MMDDELLPSTAGATVADAAYHILSGSFRSLSLALLAFSPANKSLEHIKTIPAFGPHQYLALNAAKDVVYTTSWATPPILSSWALQRSNGSRVEDVKHMNTVQITATSSYIDIPPPYNFVYSAGGPTGEVHALASDGSFGEKVQQFLFVPEDELEKADKSRIALRYGLHGVEFSSTGYGFIPVLGTSTIEMYRRDPTTGRLEHIFSSPSPRGPSSHDGPRHVKVHPNGKILYCVTEHTNYLDTYEIKDGTLHHISSHSLLPSNLTNKPSHSSSSVDPHLVSDFRGGTLMLTPSSPAFPAPIALFTTTRGATPAQKGWTSVFRLDRDGHVIPTSPPSDAPDQTPLQDVADDLVAVRFETPTSSGKANAVNIRSKDDDSSSFWILLTDDDRLADKSGAVRVLEWNGWGPDQDLRIVAEWPSGSEVEGPEKGELEFTGASHAIWLD